MPGYDGERKCHVILHLLVLSRKDGTSIYLHESSNRLVVFTTRSLLNLLLSVVLSLLLINEVEALALKLLVDEGSGEASEELLGVGVALGLACGSKSNTLA